MKFSLRRKRPNQKSQMQSHPCRQPLEPKLSAVDMYCHLQSAIGISSSTNIRLQGCKVCQSVEEWNWRSCRGSGKAPQRTCTRRLRSARWRKIPYRIYQCTLMIQFRYPVGVVFSNVDAKSCVVGDLTSLHLEIQTLHLMQQATVLRRESLDLG